MTWVKSIYHYFLALGGACFYGFPSRKIFVIGVTGTKGKSTTVELVRAIFEKSGKRVALSSTRRMVIGGQEELKTNTMTMSGRFKLQKFLKSAILAKCDYAVIEVTSQGVAQYRHKFIDFDAAVFLNIHPEHIEAHGSFEKYRKAKTDFFRSVRAASKSKAIFFINEEDLQGQSFVAAASDARIQFFGRTSFLQSIDGHREKLGQWLSQADFLIENAAAAAAVTMSEGVTLEAVLATFERFEGVGGRMDFVQREPFGVVIDYAHTPDSLRALYLALREVKGFSARLIGVFGSAGGGRDKWKRIEFGKIADNFCDEIILTSEDPYDEDPKTIAEAIARGISNKNKVSIIVDRETAIREAVTRAKQGDMVAITGMGDQKWFYGPNGKKIDWSERGIVERCLKKIN